MRKRLISISFTIWNDSNCSVKFQVCIQLFNCIISYGSCISVQRILFKKCNLVLLKNRFYQVINDEYTTKAFLHSKFVFIYDKNLEFSRYALLS